jgi:hypothetical protein
MQLRPETQGLGAGKLVENGSKLAGFSVVEDHVAIQNTD